MNANNGLGLIDFHGHLVAFMVRAELRFLRSVVYRLFALGGPVAQCFRRIRPGRHWSAEITVDERPVVSAADLDDVMAFVHPERDFVRAFQIL